MQAGVCPTTEASIVMLVADYSNIEGTNAFQVDADLSGGYFNYMLTTTEAGTYYIIGKSPTLGNPSYLGSPGTANQVHLVAGLATPVTFEAGDSNTWTQSAEAFSLWEVTL